MIECGSCTAQFPEKDPTTGVVTNQVAISPSGRGSFLSRRQAKIAARVCSGRSLIDFGCGNGSFLYAYTRLNKNSLTVIGVELDHDSLKAAQGAGLHIKQSLPIGINDSLVTMWHVAEHLAVEKQRELFRVLNSGTNALLISVPNGASFSWRRHREKFSFYDKESHFIQHTPTSLKLLLEQSGWEIHSEYRTPVYGLFNAVQTGLNLSRPHNELYSLMKRNQNSITFNLVARNLLAAIKASISIIKMMLFEVSPRKCSSYTIYAIPLGSR
jgi:hypothetical protein